MAGGDEQMLINLNSPEKLNYTPCQKTYLKNPLIPGPDVNCNIESNNPFDLVATSAENWDPFEIVLHESLKKVEYAQNVKRKPSRDDKLNNDGGPWINPRKFIRSQSVTENITFFRSPTKVSPKSKTDSPPYSADDSSPLNDSITGKIKRVVKRRVSKCIERALNASQSHPDLTQPMPSSPTKSFSNTFSFLQKNFSLPENNFNYKRIPNSGPGQSKSFSAAEYSKEELNDIFKEAKNISMSFKNMSLNSPRKQGYLDTKCENNFDAEDLMSVKPPWEEHSEYSVSSESDDNSIGLPKVKLFYLKKKEKKRNAISAEEIEHYKKRIRASLDGNMSGEEESSPSKTAEHEIKCGDISTIVLSESLVQQNKKLKEKDLPEVLPINLPVLSEVNYLRPKNRGNILRKGPLKAIVPLQKMTKSVTNKISPLRKNHANTINNSNSTKPNNSFSSSIIYPVASSTPNGKGSSSSKQGSSPNSSSVSRSRLSRRENDVPTATTTSGTRRSVSLSSETRNSKAKIPLTSVNSNVGQSKTTKLNRPHTAPSKTNSSFASPMAKKSNRRSINTAAENDKENRLQVL